MSPVLTARSPEAHIPTAAARRSRWLSVVSHLDPKYGGLSAVVPMLAEQINRPSWPIGPAEPGSSGDGRLEVSLEAFCLPGEASSPSGCPALQVQYWPTSRKAWLLDGGLRQRWQQTVAAADGVHIHGLWEQSSLVAARAARSLAKPYLVSAHGMLEPWALARSRAKKQVYAALFERATLAGAACLHALTRAEAQNYRDFGCTQPIAIVPNGVEVSDAGSGLLSPEPFLNAHPALSGKRLLLFLGRLHQKKGVELLVRAWAQVAASAPETCLVLAGPDEDGTRAVIERLVEELGLRSQVRLPGMLDAAKKWSALAASECFVLPSYSEGLSIATLEAMGAGLPVILTENCNLPEAAEAGAGWQVRAAEHELVGALAAWLGQSPAASRAMGERGRALVRSRYSWSRVASQMAALYGWVAGGPAPADVELDFGHGGSARGRWSRSGAFAQPLAQPPPRPLARTSPAAKERA